MVQATIGEGGDDLTVRLPGEVVQAAALNAGEHVEVSVSDGEITIRRMQREESLAELFRGKTPAEWRAEYADAYDWGADVGREIIAE